MTLAVAMTRDFRTDAHCQAVCVSDAPFRLKKAAIPKLPDGVPITAFLVDVDGPDHAADDAWFGGERGKIQALLAAHPGGFCYRTRGGYRLVYELSGHVIRDDDDGHRWRLFYHRSLLHLARDFGIVGDPACSDWTRLFRLPHATRDPKRGPENLETIGDATAIGAWTYEPNDLAADIATVRGLHDAFLASHPGTTTSPWGPVLKRLDPPPAPATMGPVAFVGGETKRARTALEREAASLASCPKGGRNPQCNTAAVKLGHYVASGELDETTIKHALFDAMQANGSVRDYGADACRTTIASGLEAGRKSLPATPALERNPVLAECKRVREATGSALERDKVLFTAACRLHRRSLAGEINGTDVAAELLAAGRVAGIPDDQARATIDKARAVVTKRDEANASEEPPEWLDDGPDDATDEGAELDAEPVEPGHQGEEQPGAEEPKKRARAKYNCTDLGNAERLVSKYADRIRYCFPRRKWLAWDNSRWRWDETGVLVRLAKRTVRAIYGEAAEAEDDGLRKELVRHAQKSEGADRLAAMVKLAATEAGFAVIPDELDADPWVLNCANGSVDLTTGRLRPHNRKDLCTKIAPVVYDPAARHPVWEAFLSDVTGDDPELEAFLRRVAGWSLAGVADEKRFVFLYGPPDSGKSTLFDAVSTAIGDYHVATDFTTWCTQTNTGGNRGDLVRLAGARLVTSVEVRAGARFDEALVKRVTGGDLITAAAKYESEVTFRPSFTLLLAANDAPKIRDDDAGVWSRVLRVPFPVPIPADKKNPNVRRVLTDPKQAGPAVLAWAVRGCLEWQQDGLGTCAAVQASTDLYRGEMDRIAGFFDSCCAFGEGLRVRRKELSEAYMQWCKENGVRAPLTSRDIATRLRERAVEPAKSNGQRMWNGVTLTDEGWTGGWATENAPREWAS
jgi:putative DNA primase/helicase